MPHPIQDEPTWKTDSTTNVYSRPLLGCEILYDLASRKADGLAEVCIGFKLTTSFSVNELVARTKFSLASARYYIPSMASTIVSDPKDEGLRYWNYTPLQDGESDKLSSWVNESLSVRKGSIDTEAFVAEMNQHRTPYVHSDGHEQHVHAYLLVDDSSVEETGAVNAALFLHGGHILLDGRPALRCLDALFNWIANPPAATDLKWGTEWKYLPAGPLTATGGPSNDFDTKGLELLQRVGGILTDPTPTLSFTPTRTSLAHPGKMTRFQRTFDVETSLKIRQACKKNGYTVQHLIDAALILHTVEGVESEGLKDIDISKAHCTLNPTTMAQENFLVPPHAPPSHFVGGLVMLPIRVMYTSIPSPTNPKRDRLLSLMSQIKPQYDTYLANKNTPHILPAMLALAPEYPPRELPPVGDPYSSTVSNLGNLNSFVEHSREIAGNHGAKFEIAEFVIGLRLNWFHVSFHAWTLNGRLHTMIQASDAWDDNIVKSYLDDFSENILLITKQE